MDGSLENDDCLDFSDNDLVLDLEPGEVDDLGNYGPDSPRSSPVLGKNFHRQSAEDKESQDSASSLPTHSKANVNSNCNSMSSADTKPDMHRNFMISTERTVRIQKNSKKMSLKRPGEPLKTSKEKKTSKPVGKQRSIFDRGNKISEHTAGMQSNCNDDSDAMSIYARDEDCSTLYQSKQPLYRNKQPISVGRKQFQARKSDLRNHIERPKLDALSIISDCHNQLLFTPEKAIEVAERYCKAYSDNLFQKGDEKLASLSKCLVAKLMDQNEISHLYRIVRLTNALRIVLDDEFVCDFVQCLYQKKEFGKVELILTKIRDSKLPYGDRVRRLFDRHLKLPSQEMKERTEFERLVIVAHDEPAHSSRGQHGSIKVKTSNTKIFESDSLSPPSSNRRNYNWGVKAPIAENTDAHEAEILNAHMHGNGLSMARNDEQKTVCQETIDYDKLGHCVAQMLEAVGGFPVTISLFSAFADLIVASWKEDSANADLSDKLINSDLKSFISAAINAASDKARVRTRLAWICAEVTKLIAPKSSHDLLRFMEQIGLKLVPPFLETAPSPQSRKVRFNLAEFMVNNCLQFNNLDLALHVIEEYFLESNTDFGPVLSPMIFKMLCKVAEAAYANKRYIDAAKCCTLYPAGFGDRNEASLMEDILAGIFDSDGIFKTELDEQMCNGMVDQMMARGLTTQVRRIIMLAASTANVIPVFKFLEGKGVYRKPQIANYPHHIIIPYVLSCQEMALLVSRHLTELSHYLCEMGRKIRADIPMRVILSRKTGDLVAPPLFVSNYDSSLARLHDAFGGLSPSLRQLNQVNVKESMEVMVIMNINSVKSWMLANTKYEEGPAK